MTRGTRTRRRRTVAAITILVLALPGIATAAWLASGSGNARAKADALGAGATPTLAATGRNVAVSWTSSTFLDGTGAAGYRVTRLDGAGTAQTILSACTGTITALTCTEAAVPAGTWRYAITPVHGTNWVGTRGSASSSVTIAAPTFAFDSTAAITALPATRTGTLAQFATGETVTFRLDSPTGTVLTGSSSAIGAAGTASTSTVIPAGTSQGTHTIYAIGSLGSQASATITVDTVAPTTAAAVIQKSAGGSVGYLVQGGTYYVYANVTDAVTGVSTVTADVGSVTTGLTATSLSAGSWTVGGTAYNYRSALLTANATLTAGSKNFTVRGTDAAANAATTSGFSVTVDNTGPTATDIQITNGSGTVGKPDAGDKVTFTYGEPIDPESVLAGWSGASTSVTIRLTSSGGSDRLNVYDASGTTQLPFGQVRLNDTVYVPSGTVDFSGSTMTLSGGTVTIVFGTASGTTGTSTTANTMRWTVGTGVTDRAGNACPGGNLNEPGANDIDF